jgi:2-haloacid dehalogenase
MLLHYSTSNSINEYYNFTTIAAATLDMHATSCIKKVTEEEIKETLSVIKSSLQTYPDVIKGLQLKENGFRLITLTNSPLVL